ncbi:MAG TPA: Asp-tRNA(Asn)/Glu-tRNA(Gln) amidotransferase subunit GatC [Acidimicrobiales bacterium]|nr:Asp-tRNA(Asn)/Glu-tRNA(Gln) amidotransferase subunit GatC [Acidimicrobiales bacterium]
MADDGGLTRDDAAYVARLARIDLTDEELDLYAGQLATVLRHAAQVAALDTEGVEPTAHPLPLRNVTRPDEPRPCLDRAEVLAQAPAVEDGRFRVPPILGEAL